MPDTTLKTHPGEFTCLAFSLDGTRIYTGEKENVLRAWELTKDDRGGATDIESNGGINCVAASVDCWLAASGDGVVRRYKKHETLLEGVVAAGALSARCVAVNPSSKFAAVGSDDLFLILVDLNDTLNLQKVEAHRKAMRQITWHPKEHLLTTSGCDGEIIVWDTSDKTPTKLQHLPLLPTITDTTIKEFLFDCSAVWHPSGDYFFVASRSRSVVSVRRSDWKEDRTYVNTKRSGPVTALAVSPNGAYLATSNQSKPPAIDIWDIASHKIIISHDSQTPNSGFVHRLAFSPIANLLAWVMSDGTFEILPDAIPKSHPDPIAPVVVVPVAKKLPEKAMDEVLTDFNALNDLVDDGDDTEDGPAPIDVDLEETDDEDDNENRIREMGKLSFLTCDSDSYAFVVNVTKAQPPFQPGETPLSQTKRFLTINGLGYIESTAVPALAEEQEHKFIEVKLFNESKRKSIKFRDDVGYNLGYLGERGVVFGSSSEPSQVLFKPYLEDSALSDWTYTPSSHILGITAGGFPPRGSTRNANDTDVDGFGNVVVATVDGALIFLSGTGRERRIIGLGGDVVTMVAGHEWVFVVHRAGSTTIDGFQNLSYSLINFEDFSVRQRGFLPLPKKATLKWVGITEEGAPAMFDTTGRIHVLTKFRVPHHASWARIMDTERLERKKGKDESYWPISIFGSTLLCFILKAGLFPSFGQDPYPKNPLPPPQELPIEMPFTSENRAEEKLERNAILVEIMRDGLDDELTSAEITKAEQSMDKDLVLLIQGACKLNQTARAIELAKLIHNPLFLDSVIKIAHFYKFEGLMEKIQALKSIREVEEEDRLVLAREKRRQWTRQDPLPRPLADHGYASSSAPTNAFQNFAPPPAISRPGLAPAIPVKETTRFAALMDDPAAFVPETKRKRDDLEDFSSSQDIAMPPPKQKVNPFARKNGTDAKRNPFGTKGSSNRIEKSDSFFEKVDAAEDAPKTKRGPKAKEKKEGPKQTTLFGMLSSSRKSKLSESETAVESQDSDVSMLDASSVIESQPDLPEEWEETQPIDME
ncbi:Chromosome segregation protein [Mycena indigotica]|uniref:Chromosome segregation protein n=1 Tax=Mycena indigotica TaxID=2126181 RepID=A0A8H6WI44_9AGAR|nr:Chromosome segregation protein [Mycena indigotica]KAF7315738.1 Chromosome segregation protein [Mycena indigotica]